MNLEKKKLIKGKYVIPAYEQAPIENGCVIVEKYMITEVRIYENLKIEYQK